MIQLINVDTHNCSFLGVFDVNITINAIIITKTQTLQENDQIDWTTLLDGLEEACKDSEDCKKQYKKIIEEHIEEISNYEAMVKRLQDKIKRIIRTEFSFKFSAERWLVTRPQNG